MRQGGVWEFQKLPDISGARRKPFLAAFFGSNLLSAAKRDVKPARVVVSFTAGGVAVHCQGPTQSHDILSLGYIPSNMVTNGYKL